MLNRLRVQLKNNKPSKYSVLKVIPLVIFMTIFLLGLSLGLADPGTGPPGPK